MSNLAKELAETLEAISKGIETVPLGRHWADHFGVTEGSPDYFLALTVLFNKFRELNDEIESSQLGDRAKQLYRSAIGRLEKFVSPAHAHAQQTKALKAEMEKINLLFLAAESLPTSLVPDVQPAILDALRNELEAIRELASDADVPPEIARLVSNSMRTLIMAIESYQTFGPEGFARIFGAVSVELSRALSAHPAAEAKPVKSLSQKAIGVIKKIGAVVVWSHAVVSGVDGVLESGGDIAGLLGSMGDGGGGDAQEQTQS